MSEWHLALIVFCKIAYGFLSNLVVLAIILAALLAFACVVAWGVVYVGAHMSDSGNSVSYEKKERRCTTLQK